jgi:hypothetical protein
MQKKSKGRKQDEMQVGVGKSLKRVMKGLRNVCRTSVPDRGKDTIGMSVGRVLEE